MDAIGIEGFRDFDLIIHFQGPSPADKAKMVPGGTVQLGDDGPIQVFYLVFILMRLTWPTLKSFDNSVLLSCSLSQSAFDLIILFLYLNK